MVNNYIFFAFSDGPKPVEAVSASAVTDNSVTVAWMQSVDKVDRYIVQVVGGGETIARNVSGDVTSLDILGLKERTDYNITVLAVKDGKTSTVSDQFSFRTLSDGKLHKHVLYFVNC